MKCSLSIQVRELGEQQLADTSGFQKNSSAILEAPGVLKKNKLQTKKKGVPCRQSRGSLNGTDCSGSPRCAKKTLTPPPSNGTLVLPTESGIVLGLGRLDTRVANDLSYMQGWTCIIRIPHNFDDSKCLPSV